MKAETKPRLHEKK